MEISPCHIERITLQHLLNILSHKPKKGWVGRGGFRHQTPWRMNAMMGFLKENEGKLLSHEELAVAMWGSSGQWPDMWKDAIDNWINLTRHKCNAFIQNIPRRGYIYRSVPDERPILGYWLGGLAPPLDHLGRSTRDKRVSDKRSTQHGGGSHLRPRGNNRKYVRQMAAE